MGGSAVSLRPVGLRIIDGEDVDLVSAKIRDQGEGDPFARDSKRKKSGENRFFGAFPSDPITIDDDTESNCDLQQKEVNLEDIETMKVEEDDSDSEDEGPRPASPSTTADVRLARSA
ncbi:hypothetical protein E4U60_003790 [Claviceps pazoutovae]|uniref:Uncharacterized protein n=1 Tax=Claviceps pazoutovae TaxID=1649127 RepID=A0A9P7M9H1_9HYPO|nr:hypothetical protein E4U60_003790 [Claviceps pazoutovae]